MRCPSCRIDTLDVIRDSLGHDSGRCSGCHGLWCGIDHAVALGLFLSADVRSNAIAIAHCPRCERQTLSPLDAARAVPSRPLRCIACENVWVPGNVLAAMRGSHGDRRSAGRSSRAQGVFARLRATWGVDSASEDDHHDDRHTKDKTRHPLTVAVAVPTAALLIMLLNASNTIASLQRLLLGMPFHETGHALAGWMAGIVSIPLPFFTAQMTDSGGAFAFLVSITVILAMLRVGLRRGIVFWLGCGSFAALLLLFKGVLADDADRLLWFSWSGVGGEFVLGTLCVLAFFYRMSRRPHWDTVRYVLLLVGLSVLLSSWTMWLHIEAGTEPFPLGSLLFGDSHGDMNRLLAAGQSQQDIIESYLGLAHWCFVWIAAHWLWAAWQAFVHWREKRG
jgi:hypothetical protein